MIQRIQSVYLFLAAAALGLQFVLPYAKASEGSPALSDPMFADGVFNPLDNIGLLGLTGMSVVISLIAIFLYKNRPMQGKIAGLGTMVSIMLLALAVFSLSRAVSAAFPAGTAITDALSAGIGLPGAAAIFQWLSIRSIGKDEALVRSMDRLR